MTTDPSSSPAALFPELATAQARGGPSRTLVVLSIALVVLGISGLQVAFAGHRPARSIDVENGRYLVEQVGLCFDCHSPRDEKGAFLADRWLQGAVLPFAPTVPMPWAAVSKPIAGLPTLTDDQAFTFLTKGELPDGRRPLPPMPEYRFSADDARDVIAYLRNPSPPAPAVVAH